MENTIAVMLEEEIKKTISEISAAEIESTEAKLALLKLEKLHSERIKELELELKERQRIDASSAKCDELRLRKAELELRDKQRIDDSIAKSDEAELRKAELEQRVQQAEKEAELRRVELEQKDAELCEAKRGRRWRTTLDILGIAVPTAATGWWIMKGLKFEEEGKIYSSRTAQWVSGLTRMFRKG